jgi:amino acid transporter
VDPHHESRRFILHGVLVHAGELWSVEPLNMTEGKRPSRSAGLGLLALGWLFIAGLGALQLAPDVPRTLIRWVVFVVFAPPVYALGEIAAEK